jgi:hypothetical protein
MFYKFYNWQRMRRTSVFCLLPSSPYGPDKVFVGNAFSAREVSSCDLRVNFNTRVNRDQVFYTCTRPSAMPGQLYVKHNGKDDAPGRS